MSGRVSVAYCQVARMVSTWGAEAKVQALRSEVRGINHRGAMRDSALIGDWSAPDCWTISKSARTDQEGPGAAFIYRASRRYVHKTVDWCASLGHGRTNESWASSKEQRWGIVGASCGVALGDLR